MAWASAAAAAPRPRNNCSSSGGRAGSGPGFERKFPRGPRPGRGMAGGGTQPPRAQSSTSPRRAVGPRALGAGAAVRIRPDRPPPRARGPHPGVAVAGGGIQPPPVRGSEPCAHVAAHMPLYAPPPRGPCPGDSVAGGGGQPPPWACPAVGERGPRPSAFAGGGGQPPRCMPWAADPAAGKAHRAMPGLVIGGGDGRGGSGSHSTAAHPSHFSPRRGALPRRVHVQLSGPATLFTRAPATAMRAAPSPWRGQWLGSGAPFRRRRSCAHGAVGAPEPAAAPRAGAARRRPCGRWRDPAPPLVGSGSAARLTQGPVRGLRPATIRSDWAPTRPCIERAGALRSRRRGPAHGSGVVAASGWARPAIPARAPPPPRQIPLHRQPRSTPMRLVACAAGAATLMTLFCCCATPQVARRLRTRSVARRPCRRCRKAHGFALRAPGGARTGTPARTLLLKPRPPPPGSR